MHNYLKGFEKGLLTITLYCIILELLQMNHYLFQLFPQKLKKQTKRKKHVEQHMTALITCQWLHHNCQQLWFWLSLNRYIIHFPSSSIDRDGMCRLRPGGGWLERDAGGGGGVGCGGRLADGKRHNGMWRHAHV